MQTRSKRTQPTTAAAAPPEKKPRASTTPRKKTIKPAKGPSALTTDTKILKKASRIGAHLDSLYPSPPIPLDHASPFQLLVSVMLSAQTTDVKVNQVSHHRFLLQSAQTTDANQVTPALFAAAPDARAMASMSVTDVERMIKEIGLAPTKSKNLVNMSQMLLDDHNGDVPSDIDALELLPGVGHKTASVVVAQAFGKPAFPVDTHIHRLAQRWGLTPVGLTVEQTEADLKALFAEDTWIRRHLQIIYFGREHCPAQKHDPSACPICEYAAVAPFNKVGSSPPRPGAPKRN